jgi:orotidine-5'-phosphate decarboxylase
MHIYTRQYQDKSSNIYMHIVIHTHVLYMYTYMYVHIHKYIHTHVGKYQDKGAFILCKTSNKSSKDFQELKLMNGDEMYQSVAKLCNTWNLNTIETNSAPCVGLVAGATDIRALRVVRETAPDIWILCPGVGAQGGDAETVCSVGLRKSDGYGLLVSGEYFIRSQ